MNTAKINIRDMIRLPSEWFQIAEAVRMSSSYELLNNITERFNLDDNGLFWIVEAASFHNTQIKIHNGKHNI
jgi:hypothetical protein